MIIDLQKLVLYFLFLTFAVSLQGQTTSITYDYSLEDFANPERGWYRYSATRSGNYTALDSATIAGYRLLHTPFSAGYSIHASLVFRYFFLEDFKTGPISTAYLDAMEQDFITARKAGVKLIPRFAYTDEVDNSCGSSFCPPYGDASKAILLSHIAQLKPLLQNYGDILLGVQMGFIGIWGENYYTDYFGDASQSPFTLSATNWTDRIEVLDSLLAAVPINRNVQVRYPQMKQKEVYGVSAPTSSNAMVSTEAYTGSNKSRIGFHNDCFLASASDFGTYNDYDNAVSDTLTLKPYQAIDSKYVLVGGETCSPSSFSTCDVTGGNTLEDMSRFHYTYLNADFNNDVNDSWIGVCMDSIKRSLGYRLALTSATYDNAVAQGNSFTFNINIENKGFAAPINERDVYLVFINSANLEEWQAKVEVDPRYWYTGSHSFSGTVCLPNCMAAGNYNLYLKLSDPAPILAFLPEFNIQLANQNTWDANLGINDLGHTLVVTSNANDCSSTENTTHRINYWKGDNSGTWHSSASNWSLNKIPDLCDAVVIPSHIEVTILSGTIARAKTVNIFDQGGLIIENGGQLEVIQ